MGIFESMLPKMRRNVSTVPGPKVSSSSLRPVRYTSVVFKVHEKIIFPRVLLTFESSDRIQSPDKYMCT